MFLCYSEGKQNKQKSNSNNNESEINNISNINTNDKIQTYKCPDCLIVPEISNINYSENEILLECPFHKENLMDIKNYLNSLNFNTCQICNIKFTSKDSSYYCYQCKKSTCYNCKINHDKKHNLININEYNIKCQIHFGKNYEYYCYNCSSNLCETCFNNHDNKHNIKPLSDLFIKNEDLDYILKKNKEYNKIIQIYQNYTSLNNIILDTYKNYKNNFYYIKNIKNLIRFIKNTEIIENKIKNIQKNLKNQSSILEKFNYKYSTELTIDTDVIYLNWKSIEHESLEFLTKIEFTKLREFQSVGTNIKDLFFLKNAKFPILQELYLTDNNISDLSILEKVDFPLLKIIYLNKNNIRDISILSKVNFPELNKLFLDSNNINDISVLEKINFPNLEILKLCKNEISDISVLKKIKLKLLRLLYIKKNKIDYTLKKNLEIIDELRDKSIRIVY